MRKGKPPKTTFYKRKSGKVMERVTIYLPATLSKRLRMHAADEGRRMSDLLKEYIETGIGKKKPRRRDHALERFRALIKELDDDGGGVH